MAEIDAAGIAAMFTTYSDLYPRFFSSGFFDAYTHKLSNAAPIKDLEGIVGKQPSINEV